MPSGSYELSTCVFLQRVSWLIEFSSIQLSFERVSLWSASMAPTHISALSLATCFLFSLVHASQPSAPDPIPAPLRELEWGQLNFLHTTDTHGWHGGHLQEPSYSADWGDYISFTSHLRAKADAEGTDLLVVDTGDRVDGNGLYDASNPRGKYTFDIFKHQEIDIICSGNHELYKAFSAENERRYTVPNYAPNYLASNLDIRSADTSELEALAPRFRKFTTKNQGLRIMAFGFLFNFQGYANNTFVRPVEDAIKEQWFQDAIRDRDVDLFVVAGHVAAESEEYQTIFKAIRQQQWDTPIQFFAGHTHIRDFKKYDEGATAMESGRYMETIGFLSIDGVGRDKRGSVSAKAVWPTIKRRYIDNNLYSLYYHSNTDKATFPTELGDNVTALIVDARKELDLDHTHGCAPKTLWIDRVDVTSEDSLFSWLGNNVIPDVLHESDVANPKIMMTNTGAMRFDIFKGPFTVDSAYLVSPFTSGFRHIQNVNYEVAKKLLHVLNNEEPMLAIASQRLDLSQLRSPEQRSRRSSRDGIMNQPIFSKRSGQVVLSDEPSLIPGYTTKDDFGNDGDDTQHSPIPFVRVPNCIQSEVDFPEDRSSVQSIDLVYNEFIEPWIILALRFLGVEYDDEDTSPFLKGTSMTEAMASWVEKNWPCES